MTKRKTHEKFISEVYELVGNEYKVLGQYINALTKIKVVHNKCNTVYEVKPNNLLIGQRCPACYGNIRKTDERFKKEVFELVGTEYEVLEPYVNGKTKLLFRHSLCNNFWRVIPESFLVGNRCPFCSGSMQKDTELFKKDVYDQVGDEYVVLSEYTTSKRKILMKHEKCEHEWMITPNNFLNGQRCPNCRITKGEKRIKEFLENNIKYISQYGFKQLKGFGGKKLRFDFATFDKDNKLLYLIEYDGKQHFEPVDFGGRGKEWAEEQFKEIQEKDQLKNKFCKANDINLIRIPYWKFDEINTILNNLIIKNKHIKIDENYIVK
jgi:Zn ribbon nucleic-acid-binding protein